MAQIQYGTLNTVPMSQLLDAWNAGFGDYQVSMQTTEGGLAGFFRQNGVKLELSQGAFDGGKIVGFWFNGVRNIGGVPTAYDSGTAIAPDYRSLGISKELAQMSDRALIREGVREYVLEVLADNERAFEVYRKSGFEVTRELLSFKTTAPLAGAGADEFDIAPDIFFLDEWVGESFWGRMPDMMEYRPSWQNRNEAVLAINDQIAAVTAHRNGRVIGYGVIQTTRGRIPQIGVAREYRDTDIPSAILTRLGLKMEEGSPMVVINVDPAAERTIALLETHGFEQFAKTIEMKKSL